jgi:peptidoglycan/LPS O-acetylase OafA/YrhL
MSRASATPAGFGAGYFSFARTPHAIPELDGLRAFAVLLVLFRHALHPLQHDGTPLLAIGGWDLAVPFVNGWIGVDLFFVLSGFLITCHLMRARAGERGRLWTWKHYLTARALRIVPTYLFVMGIVIAGAIPLYMVDGPYLGIRVLYHALFLQDYLPANIVVSFWSLGVEEKFYLLAPPLMLLAGLMKTAGRRYALLGALIVLPTLFRLITAWRHPEIGDYEGFFPVFRSPFHMSFDGLAIGVMCAHLYMDRALIDGLKNLGAFRFGLVLGLVLVVAHLAVADLMADITWYDKSLQPLAISLGFGLILLSVICDGRSHLVLKSRVALVLARISYPLYLIHLPLVPLAIALQPDAASGGVLGIANHAVFFISISILLALAIHFVVEKPFLLLKDRLSIRHRSA